MGLEVKALAGGIGADEDAHWMLVWRRLERTLEVLLFLEGSRTMEYLDALFPTVSAGDGGLELM